MRQEERVSMLVKRPYREFTGFLRLQQQVLYTAGNIFTL